MEKGKEVTVVKKIQEENIDYELDVFVDCSMNIDRSFNDANAGRLRRYYVVAWMEPDHTIRSYPVICDGDAPSWKAGCKFHINQPFNIEQFLKVEVIRINIPSRVNIPSLRGRVGTSTGGEIETSDREVVVGRAQVPLPNDCFKELEGWVDLVKFTESGCRLEGEIKLTLKLTEKFKKRRHIW